MLQLPRKLGAPFVVKGAVDQSFYIQFGTLLNSTDCNMVCCEQESIISVIDTAPGLHGFLFDAW